MTPLERLRHEFNAEEDTFLLTMRCECLWDPEAFQSLTSAMYDVAVEVHQYPTIEKWIAEGFWFCDTWIREWTSHPNFPRPNKREYEASLQLIHDLAWFLFMGESPYLDNTLSKRAKGKWMAGNSDAV